MYQVEYGEIVVNIFKRKNSSLDTNKKDSDLVKDLDNPHWSHISPSLLFHFFRYLTNVTCIHHTKTRTILLLNLSCSNSYTYVDIFSRSHIQDFSV